MTIVESEVHDPTLMGSTYMGENRPSSDEESGGEDSKSVNEDKQDKKIYIKLVFFHSFLLVIETYVFIILIVLIDILTRI